MNNLKEERITCFVPNVMFPGQKHFETLGFTFKDSQFKYLYQATLPKGWKYVATDSSLVLLIDEKGRERGFYHNYFMELKK